MDPVAPVVAAAAVAMDTVGAGFLSPIKPDPTSPKISTAAITTVEQYKRHFVCQSCSSCCTDRAGNSRMMSSPQSSCSPTPVTPANPAAAAAAAVNPAVKTPLDDTADYESCAAVDRDASTSSRLEIRCERVEVRLEIGHSATLRLRPTAEGLTHDWQVYVTTQPYIERVEFHLHETFDRHRLVLKEPPFRVSESGYGCFVLPIDVYFRSSVEPRRARFFYELVLDSQRSVINVRYEKLVFFNPPELFRNSLVDAGAVVYVNRPRRYSRRSSAVLRPTDADSSPCSSGYCSNCNNSASSFSLIQQRAPRAATVNVGQQRDTGTGTGSRGAGGGRKRFELLSHPVKTEMKEELDKSLMDIKPQLLPLSATSDNNPDDSPSTAGNQSMTFLQSWLRHVTADGRQASPVAAGTAARAAAATDEQWRLPAVPKRRKGRPRKYVATSCDRTLLKSAQAAPGSSRKARLSAGEKRRSDGETAVAAATLALPSALIRPLQEFNRQRDDFRQPGAGKDPASDNEDFVHGDKIRRQLNAVTMTTEKASREKKIKLGNRRQPIKFIPVSVPTIPLSCIVDEPSIQKQKRKFPIVKKTVRTKSAAKRSNLLTSSATVRPAATKVLPVTSSGVTAPAKRPRGRPRKYPIPVFAPERNVVPPAVSAAVVRRREPEPVYRPEIAATRKMSDVEGDSDSDSDSDVIVVGYTAPKRSKSKVSQFVAAPVIDIQPVENRKRKRSSTKLKPTVAACVDQVEPVRRKRGRPPKINKPVASYVSRDDVVRIPEVAKIRNSRLDESAAAQRMTRLSMAAQSKSAFYASQQTSRDASRPYYGEMSSSSDEDGDNVELRRKRRRISATEEPEVVSQQRAAAAPSSLDLSFSSIEKDDSAEMFLVRCASGGTRKRKEKHILGGCGGEMTSTPRVTTPASPRSRWINVERPSVETGSQGSVAASCKAKRTLADDIYRAPRTTAPVVIVPAAAAVPASQTARSRWIVDDRVTAAPQRRTEPALAPPAAVTLSVASRRKPETASGHSSNEEDDWRPTGNNRKSTNKVGRNSSVQRQHQQRAADVVVPETLESPFASARNGSGKVVACSVPTAVIGDCNMDKLVELQRRLATTTDTSVLRRVVEIIEQSGRYRVEDATFDFDLCSLDPATIAKLRRCLNV